MLLSFLLENFSPAEQDAIQETKPKWWNINLYHLRLLYGFVDCFNFTTASEVEKHTRPKLCHFCCYVGKAKLFCQKMFRPNHLGWSVHMDKTIFIPISEIEEFVNHAPAARGLQILLVFYQHPTWFISF